MEIKMGDKSTPIVDVKVTPETIRRVIKDSGKHGEHRFTTTEEAAMFLTLFGEQIEDAIREAIREEVRRHYG